MRAGYGYAWEPRTRGKLSLTFRRFVGRAQRLPVKVSIGLPSGLVLQCRPRTRTAPGAVSVKVGLGVLHDVVSPHKAMTRCQFCDLVNGLLVLHNGRKCRSPRHLSSRTCDFPPSVTIGLLRVSVALEEAFPADFIRSVPAELSKHPSHAGLASSAGRVQASRFCGRVRLQRSRLRLQSEPACRGPSKSTHPGM
jgi:hypothetical protein